MPACLGSPTARRHGSRLPRLWGSEAHMAVARRASRGSNKNDVPSAAERRALKAWMLAEYGDGISVVCAGPCGRVLLWSQITRDRFPIPGRKGGKYVRGNIRPMCSSCNSSDGAKQAALERAEAKERKERQLARRRELYRLRKQQKSEVV